MNLYKQYVLNFPNQISYQPDTYVLGNCNTVAHTWLMSTDIWGNYGLILSGPKGCGKTHLAHIWQIATHARFITHRELEYDLMQLIQHDEIFILENIEQLIHMQAEIFHLINLIKEDQKKILLTVTDGLNAVPFTLKDLMTRLKSLPMAVINLPDDTICEAIMVKCFADMQLHIDDRIIHYLLTRCERSYQNIHNLVKKVYHLSKASHQRITLPFVKSIL